MCVWLCMSSVSITNGGLLLPLLLPLLLRLRPKVLRAQRMRTARSLTGKKVIAGEDPDEVERWEKEMMAKENETTGH